MVFVKEWEKFLVFWIIFIKIENLWIIPHTGFEPGTFCASFSLTIALPTAPSLNIIFSKLFKLKYLILKLNFLISNSKHQKANNVLSFYLLYYNQHKGHYLKNKNI